MKQELLVKSNRNGYEDRHFVLFSGTCASPFSEVFFDSRLDFQLRYYAFLNDLFKFCFKILNQKCNI